MKVGVASLTITPNIHSLKVCFLFLQLRFFWFSFSISKWRNASTRQHKNCSFEIETAYRASEAPSPVELTSGEGGYHTHWSWLVRNIRFLLHKNSIWNPRGVLGIFLSIFMSNSKREWKMIASVAKAKSYYFRMRLQRCWESVYSSWVVKGMNYAQKLPCYVGSVMQGLYLLISSWLLVVFCQ